MEGYGERLIMLRGNRTQREISEALGISDSAVGMYEREERIPKDELKIKMAKFFGVTVSYIFFPENATN